MSLLYVNSLTKEYTADFSLKNISFSADEKGIYAFLGVSGSGKSALAALLAGADVPDCAEVLYRDTEMYKSERATAQIKRRIGYLPTTPELEPSMTVLELLDLYGSVRGVEPDKRYRQIKEALELVGLEKYKDTLVCELRRAEKKLVGFAAALLGGTEVLILDEPLRHLGADESEIVLSTLEMLCRRKVILLFTSKPELAERLATHIGIMDCGELLLFEEKESLLKRLRAGGGNSLADALSALRRDTRGEA